ncbi:hypothetical protein EMCRGX_G008672 [Ephydatia muelleri]
MAAQDRLLKYPSAFDLQSYHLSRVVADADVARSKLNELTDAIKRFSLVNRSGAEETKSDGEQPTNPLSSTKRWLSDLNMLDEVGGEGNRGNSLYIPLAISSNARPTSSEAILDSTRTDISAGEGGARERLDFVSSMATLTESSRRVGGAIGEEEREEKMMRLKRGRPLSQSPDAEGVVGPSMMEALDLLVKDFNRLSVTLDGDKEVTSPFPLTNAGAEDLKRRTCSSAVLERRERGTSGSTYLWTTRAPPTFETCVPRARRRRRPSLTASSPRSMKPGTPLVPSLRSQKRENSPLGAWSKLKGAPERRRKHSLPTIKMLGNSTDSTSTQISTSSSTSLDTSFLYRLSSASGGSHDDPEAMLALKTLVRMFSNRECLATIVSYVCLPKFTSKLLGTAQSPHSSPEVLTSVATLVQNLYEVGGAEGKKLALGSGMLDLTVKLLNTRDPVPVGRVNDSSFSPHSTNLHGQPVTYLEARHIVLKMLAIASNHSKMQHDLSTSHTISLLTSCLGDPFEENMTNGMICLANLAQNVDSHPLLVQAKLAEKLGGLIFDGLRTRFHATRALVYLGHLDMVKMSLFDPYPSDGDSVLWSDESFSSTARYARLQC